MTKPRVRYGILDDFGEVIRWQWDKPSSCYKFITKRVVVKPVVDWAGFEEAMF